MGQKFEKVEGLGILGIRTMEVLVKDLGKGSAAQKL